MKQLKFLFINLMLSISGISALQAQEEINFLAKGEEIFANEANRDMSQSTTKKIIAPGGYNYAFYYSYTHHQWIIKVPNTNENSNRDFIEKSVNFVPISEQQNAISQKLELDNNGNLKLMLVYNEPMPPNGQLRRKSELIVTGCHSLELSNQGGLVAKNASGAVIWGPNFGN